MNILKSHITMYKRMYLLKTKKHAYASCEGGFCEIPKAKETKNITSKGEGLVPPYKNEKLPAYQLSYPGNTLIEPVTIGALKMSWMGRRWYTSP